MNANTIVAVATVDTVHVRLSYHRRTAMESAERKRMLPAQRAQVDEHLPL
jgi:hypothetical protein